MMTSALNVWVLWQEPHWPRMRLSLSPFHRCCILEQFRVCPGAAPPWAAGVAGRPGTESVAACSAASGPGSQTLTTHSGLCNLLSCRPHTTGNYLEIVS